jgi:mannose/fructose/N-acetylgalactosamine-specific phosphotransferase system component IIC
MGNPEARQALLNLLVRYLHQPSTWQGLALGFGSLSAYLGVPVEQAAAGVALVIALILIFRDERKSSEVIEDVVAKVLEDKVDKS